MRAGCALVLWLVTLTAHAEHIQVAVAANFAPTLKRLIAEYQAAHPQADIDISVASTGKLAIQIRHGAPYDLFLSADAKTVDALAQDNLLRPSTVRTYALGLLGVWLAEPPLRVLPEQQRQQAPVVNAVALANPRFAPYGVASEQALRHWPQQQAEALTLVYADNVAQAMHFARSQTVDAAFVAQSYVDTRDARFWPVPRDWYRPIIQQGALLTDTPLAVDFFAFMLSERGQALIVQSGYLSATGSSVGGKDAQDAEHDDE